MQRNRWTSLLEGHERERALEAAFGIAEPLRRALFEPPASERKGWGLADDPAGLALLFGYADLVRPGAGWDEATAEALGRAVDAMGTHPMPPHLYGGFSGIAWTAAHLGSRVLETDSAGSMDEDLAEIDRNLQMYLRQTPWRGHFDLISGLVGLGVYALERLPAETAHECLRLIVDRLDEKAVDRTDGLSWWSDPEYIGGPSREKTPKGHFNLGMAHGVPGVIGLLGRAASAGVSPPQVHRLLEGATAWLWNQSLPSDSSSRFPTYITDIADELPSGVTRSAWCYGDPGVAAALLLAAVETGDRELQSKATELAVFSARRPPTESGVQDAGLCHGAAGLAHIYNRMYQATGEAALARAAHVWLDETLRMRDPNRFRTGFQFYIWDHRADALLWSEEPSVLTGAAGVGLALLAAAAPVPPDWDRMLMLSIPPSGTQGDVGG